MIYNRYTLLALLLALIIGALGLPLLFIWSDLGFILIAVSLVIFGEILIYIFATAIWDSYKELLKKGGST